MNYNIRKIRKDEYILLEDFLYEAIFIPEGVEPPPRSIINQPDLQVYIRNFGEEKDDICFIAEVGNKVVGAVWVRDMNDYGHIADGVPSFAISLYKEYRNYGIGTRLMKTMLSELKGRGYEKASLAVQKANYAVRMYKNVGFTVVDENDDEYIMVCELDSITQSLLFLSSTFSIQEVIRMKRKATSALLAIMLMLSGCNANTQTAKTSTAETQTTPASATEAATEQTEAEIKKYESRYQLSNPDADINAQKLYDYINDVYGTAIITAQQESTWMGSPDYEMNYIFEKTGKYPAIRGLDFMNNDFDGVVERSIEWHEKGGIVTICWHTGVISSGYQESKDDNPDFEKLLTEGTDEYNQMIESWDKAAVALQELRDAGVPVLWRPFHEFDGGWFWWGKGGGENFIKLWQMMYDRYTNEFGLTNLIWVLGYCGEVKNGWYPGDEYCDIIGSDTYDNSTHVTAWNKLSAMETGKPLTFHECGKVPRIPIFERDGAMWSWFMIWHTDYITGNSVKVLNNVYNDEKAITLDELPDIYS